MGFVRRFSDFPGVETITLIEGVIIVDLPPPGFIEGVGTGVACLVGEFADFSSAVSVTTAGVVASAHKPVEVFGGQDLLEKMGGFDETLGQFGGDCGSAFVELRNKQFSRLVCVAVNLAATAACRVYRELPTNISATVAQPIIGTQQGIVVAGREFRDGADRVRNGQRHVFNNLAPRTIGVDGDVTSIGTAVTQLFDSAGSTFIADGVVEGDVLVLGVINGAGALGANAATYRVTVTPVSEIQLTVEQQDGVTFDWSTGGTLPFRVEPGANADSGPLNQLSEAAGYRLPVRPLDATISSTTNMAPTVVPPTASETLWDALSGLRMVAHPSTDVTFVPDVHTPNTASTATMSALYQLGFNSLITEEEPGRAVNLLWAARKDSLIASAGRQHVLTASSQGIGRTFTHSPPLDAPQTTAAAIAAAYPGVGAFRDERVWYAWPGVQHFIPEAIGFAVGTADGNTNDEGLLDTTMDSWVVALASNIAPERSIASKRAPATTILSPILGFQRVSSGTLSLNVENYIAHKREGVVSVRFLPNGGTPTVQSQVTTSQTAGQEDINRRRFADFLQDSAAQRLLSFNEEPLTQSLKDAAEAELQEFLLTLQSRNNPPASRLDSFEVDPNTGNTPSLEAQGIFVLIGRVRMFPLAKHIVFQTEVGPGVVINSTT